MMWRGRLERRDLGTGAWVLHTADGTVALYGDVPGELDGKSVEVTGKTFEGMGIGMTGDPMVQVSKVRAVEG
jgi:hypothetical protein